MRTDTRTDHRDTGTDISVEHVCKAYGNTTVFDDLNLSIIRGEVTLIMGPSGGGKTTLLRMLMGLEQPDSGCIYGIDNILLAVVFQEDRLCENLSVSANICLPHAGIDKSARRQLEHDVEEMLDAVGLTDCACRPVHELSGGMKRRVAILRAVMAQSDAVFFDEPLKGLDEKTKHQVMDAIMPLMAGKTVVWVTHDRNDLTYFEAPHLIEMSG